MRSEQHRYETEQFNLPKHRLPEGRRSGNSAALRAHRVPRWVYRVILILALSTAAVLVWCNRGNLAPENVLAWAQSHIVGFGIGDGYPKTIAGSSVNAGNFVSSGKNIYFASDTSVVVCNSTARELLDHQHSFSSPVLKVNGPRALLYNMGGKSCQTETVGRDAVKITTGRDILAGALSANGRAALITQADGYCGMLTVYNENGSVKFYYWFYEYYPSAVAMNPDGTKAAVAGVSAKDGEIVSAVYIIDANSAKTVQPVAVYNGNMIHSIYWDTDSTVVAVGDTAASAIRVSSGSKSDFSYGGGRLTAFCSDGGRTALGISAYGGSSDCRLVVLDKNDGQVFSRPIHSTVESVSLFGQTAAALANGSVDFYSLSDPSGGVISRTAGSDARAVALRDESSAYVLGITEIRLISGR